MSIYNDKFNDECGIFGIWNEDDFDAGELIYLALYGLAHRGQQSSGIAVNDKRKVKYYKDVGLVNEVFDESIIDSLRGNVGIGHVGYNILSENKRENVLPLITKYSKGQMALSYNGSLLNASEIKSQFESIGFFFQTNSDAEVIAMLLSRERVKFHSIEDALCSAMKEIKGSYSLLVMTPNKLIAVRDPHGMRPLCYGKIENSFVFASESSAFNTIGATFVRDVRPGEIIIIEDGKMRSIQTKTFEKTAMCIFEFVYLARPDSYIDNISVYSSRFEAGKILAEECPADADLVIGVPDSGIAAALGYSNASGIAYAEGMIKNRYIGRTFIQPSQSMRERGVELKLSAIRNQIEGKRIVLIDDSIVRGTTSQKIVQMLREVGGASEIHMRISSAPVKYSCHYGIDTPNSEVLLANKYSLDDMCKNIGADSLGFLSIDGLLKAHVDAKCHFCSACFDGNYPIPFEEV